jgi:hypothetical protein
MKKIKLTKEQKAQHRLEDKAWKDMIRRAISKGALIEETNWQIKPQDDEV